MIGNRRRLGLAILILGVVAAAAFLFLPRTVRAFRISRLAQLWSHEDEAETGRQARAASAKPEAKLVAGSSDRLQIPDEVAKSLGVRTEAAKTPSHSRSLTLSGSLALDTNRLAHVHTRFSGEVVELGTVKDAAAGAGPNASRQIRFGDWVEKGQLLAVLWSADLGEKKSEYVDALSRLRLEQETLARLEDLLKDQAVPERNVRETRHTVESAQIAVARVERTLQTWRLSDEEIAAVRAEAAPAAVKRYATRDRQKSWARVELRAPLTGVVLEKNLTVGDIVDTATDLFKIGDLGVLSVWAYIYEEDLAPLLRAPKPVKWMVRLKADSTAPAMSGKIEEIGAIIDPNQHTALVMGSVDNHGSQMKAGQFITATIDLPPEQDEVEISAMALVEDGQESVVFAQVKSRPGTFDLKRVRVSKRLGDVVYIHSDSTDAIQAGDQVVVSGAVELRAALSDYQASSRASQ